MRAFLSLLMLAALLWLASVAWFLLSLPGQGVPADVKSDAIVVLTGGADRVEHGLDLLAAGAAPVLFVSGVGPHVTLAQLLGTHATPALQERTAALRPNIVLGHRASTTQTNADEAEAFVRARNLHSIRLVTALYHMPRSNLEFHRAMPDVTIIADPVFPADFRRADWWRHATTRRLIASEYWKYYGAMLRPKD